MPEPRTIPTADVLRALEYDSPRPGFHRHGKTLIPTDGCAACAELRRRQMDNADGQMDKAPADPKVSGGSEVAGLSQPE